MLQRFIVTLVVAFAAMCAVGLLSRSIGQVLIGVLVVGLLLVVAMVLYVLMDKPTGANERDGVFH